MPRPKPRKLPIPLNYSHLVFAHPVDDGTPFPFDALAYGGPLGFAVPNREADSGRIVTHPALGDTKPFFLRVRSIHSARQCVTHAGWRFVPMEDKYEHYNLYDAGQFKEVMDHAHNLPDHYLYGGTKADRGDYIHYGRLTRGDYDFPFPIDMLRYDNCSFASVEDVRRAFDVNQSVVYVAKLDDPTCKWTEDRWASYGRWMFEPVSFNLEWFLQ